MAVAVKFNMNITGITLMICLVLCLGACIKLKPGIETTITGTVTDQQRQLPLPGVKLVVMEYVKSSALSRPAFNRNIDSVITRADGTYTAHFATTGDGIEYHVGIAAGSRLFKDSYREAIVRTGHDTVINFQPVPLHTISASVHINDYTNPPPVSVYSRATGSFASLYHHPLDTVCCFDALADQDNILSFSVADDDTAYLSNHYIKVIRFPGYTDTLQVQLTIDPGSFTR